MCVYSIERLISQPVFYPMISLPLEGSTKHIGSTNHSDELRGVHALTWHEVPDEVLVRGIFIHLGIKLSGKRVGEKNRATHTAYNCI